MRNTIQAIAILALIGACLRVAYTQEHAGAGDNLDLSAEVRNLLQAEMQELAGASQAVVISFVSGDWEAIQRIGEQIRASYVMKQNLTEEQKKELADKLPDRFKRLDMEFHERADRLGAAAAARDPEIVAFHLHRLLEACARCHAEYAGSRFPGFASDAVRAHRH